VLSVKPRGPYLDFVLRGDGVEMRAFALASERCLAVIRPEQAVVYDSRGAGGGYTGAGQTCEGAGLGDPFVSRFRQPRGRTPGGSPVPRAQATFSILYEDAEVVLLHGRFPLAKYVGWAGGADSVAVVANSSVCRGPVDRGVASMEYRPAGRNTLALIGDGGLCRIEGLAMPPPQAARP
jgi:hypothetical protein